MDLVHCIYCSAASGKAFGPTELTALLDVCRTNNAALDVTGMLLFHEGSFFQILEGDRPVVDALYDKVALDKRHGQVRKLIIEPIEERDFGAWTMGYPKVTARDLQQIPGLNDFFASSKTYLELGEGRAKTLLAAFKEGQWRARF